MNKTVNQVLRILGYIISFVLTINKKKAEDKDRKSNERTGSQTKRNRGLRTRNRNLTKRIRGLRTKTGSLTTKAMNDYEEQRL